MTTQRVLELYKAIQKHRKENYSLYASSFGNDIPKSATAEEIYLFAKAALELYKRQVAEAPEIYGSFDAGRESYYMGWLLENCFTNELAVSSSGSFFTAYTDDGYAQESLASQAGEHGIDLDELLEENNIVYNPYTA